MWFARALPAVVVSGVALGIVCAVQPVPAAALALAMASVGVVVDGRMPRAGVFLVAVLVAAMAHGAWARARALASPLQTWFEATVPTGRADTPVQFEGTLADDASASDDGVRLVVDVDALFEGPRRRAIDGRVQAHVSGRLAFALVHRWTMGRRVRVPVLVREPDLLLNPGGPTEMWQRLHRTADLIGTIKSGALVDVAAGPWWAEWGARVRQYVRQSANRYVAPAGQQSSAIVTAILIGDRAGLDPDVVRRLQAAGTYHVIAISGGNVALLATLCAGLLRIWRRAPRAASVVTIAIVVTYGWLVGGGASVDRAVVAACIYLLVSLAGLAPDPLRVLGLVALVVAVADPMAVVDVSAWLSFGASLGIIVGAGRFLRWARGGDHEAARARHWYDRIWVACLGLFSATLSAELALAPVSVAVFSRVGMAGLVLNFVAIPAMAVVETSGMAAVALSGWAGPVASVAGVVARDAAWLLVASSKAVDVAPWLSWRTPSSPIAWTAVYYGAAAVFVWCRDWRRSRRVAGLVALVSLGVILSAPGVAWRQPRVGFVRVTVLDVGQGDSILVQVPGHALLVDAGGGGGAFDLGSRIVTPALWASGVRRLDYLAFTHPDLDHIGGTNSVARDLDPREIWEGVPVPPNAERQALYRAAQSRGIVWRHLAAGHVIDIGSAEIDVLNPPLPDWERQKTRNEDSIVLRLRYGGVEMLLTGDAGEEFEHRVEPFVSPAPVRLLKVGHHGSRSSSTPAFVADYRPSLAFVSVGRGNLFGHPAPEVLARYAAVGTEVFRTDRDGAIVIETDGRDVHVTTMSGRTRVVLER